MIKLTPLIESSLSRVWQMVEEPNRKFAVISAYRYHDSESYKYQAELMKTVRELGFGYIRMNGGYVEKVFADDSTEQNQKYAEVPVHEESILIPNISKEKAMELGAKYNQDSILYKDKDSFQLIGTNKATGFGNVIMTFKFGAGKDNFDQTDRGVDPKDAFKDAFSALVKGSHSDRKFKFVAELEEMSVNRGYTVSKKPLEWRTIYEVKGE
jgi:hypothetical protein